MLLLARFTPVFGTGQVANLEVTTAYELVSLEYKRCKMTYTLDDGPLDRVVLPSGLIRSLVTGIFIVR